MPYQVGREASPSVSKLSVLCHPDNLATAGTIAVVDLAWDPAPVDPQPCAENNGCGLAAEAVEHMNAGPSFGEYATRHQGVCEHQQLLPPA